MTITARYISVTGGDSIGTYSYRMLMASLLQFDAVRSTI